jgi:hypothetical protein
MTHTIAHVISPLKTDDELKFQACKELGKHAHILKSGSVSKVNNGSPLKDEDIDKIGDDVLLIGFNSKGDLLIFDRNDKSGNVKSDCDCNNVLDDLGKKDSKVHHVRTVTFIVYEASPTQICVLDNGEVICKPKPNP